MKGNFKEIKHAYHLFLKQLWFIVSLVLHLGGIKNAKQRNIVGAFFSEATV